MVLYLLYKCVSKFVSEQFACDETKISRFGYSCEMLIPHKGLKFLEELGGRGKMGKGRAGGGTL